jgi:hypothetical protein
MFSFKSVIPTGLLLGFGAMLLSGQVPAPNQGRPGSINYVEGQVRLDGQMLGQDAMGANRSVVNPGQVLETQQGKAEVLLTPGVFLRLGDNTAIRLDSPALTNTRVAVLRGEAMVEVDQLYKENNLQVQAGGATARLVKTGVYAFTSDPAKIRVFDGEAQVNTGDRRKTVKQGHEASMNGGVLQEAKFNRDMHDDLYLWSNLRSEYVSEASVASARTYVVGGGGWYGGGWYWNPWFSAYSFIPGDGFLYGPFGWGFFSPGFVGYAPFYGGYYGRGGYRGYPGRGVAAVRSAPAFRSSVGVGATAFRGGGGFGGGRR